MTSYRVKLSFWIDSDMDALDIENEIEEATNNGINRLAMACGIEPNAMQDEIEVNVQPETEIAGPSIGDAPRPEGEKP